MPESFKKYAILAVSVVGLLLLVTMITSLVTTVDAGEIVVKQSIVSGNLEVWTKPGPEAQLFGGIERYKKSDHYEFGARSKGDESTTQETENCLRARFNDQGTASICGSVTYDMPESPGLMKKLHTKFRSMEAIEQRLIRPALDRAVYNSGPLMSSRESATDRRAELITAIREQAIQGVFDVESREAEVEDFFAEPVIKVEMVPVPVKDDDGNVKVDDHGKPVMEMKPREVKEQPKKRVKLVEPRMQDGKHVIAEPSAISEYGIRLYNFTINRIVYDDRVTRQIVAQQEATMAIQTARAEAQKAQQDAITAKSKGDADIARTKAAEEVKKQEQVTRAEARRVVAEQDKATAQLAADAVLIKAKADAESKKMRILADGALDKKLETLKAIHASWAQAASQQPLVPQIVMGGDGGSGRPVGIQQMMELMTAQAAQQLRVDTRVSK